MTTWAWKVLCLSEKLTTLIFNLESFRMDVSLSKFQKANPTKTHALTKNHSISEHISTHTNGTLPNIVMCHIFAHMYYEKKEKKIDLYKLKCSLQ